MAKLKELFGNRFPPPSQEYNAEVPGNAIHFYSKIK